MSGVLKKKLAPFIVRGNANVRTGVPSLSSTQIFAFLVADTPL